MASNTQQEFLGFVLPSNDERVKDWFLMQSFWPTAILAISYLVIVKLGMYFMKDRKPFELSTFTRVYNVFTVGLNAYMLHEFVYVAIAERMGLCTPVNTDPNNKNALRLAAVIWWYYFSKMIEFIDTFVFVLRKKNNQVSFLHLYHHSTMFPLWWLGVKWCPGGQAYFAAMINCFVHVVMYSYYFISTYPKYKDVWWKKYITHLQLGQFYIVLLDTIYAAIVIRLGYCVLYEWMAWGLIIYMGTMIILFNAFYAKAYSKKKKEASSSAPKKEKEEDEVDVDKKKEE